MEMPQNIYVPEHDYYGEPGGRIGPRELSNGEFETEHMYADKLVKLSQIRGTKNKVSAQLKESIRHDGLMNSIDCVRMSENLLGEYIAFTNEVWGGDVSLADLADMRLDDGTYRLVAAGHTRHDAFLELENDAVDPIRRKPMQIKIHDANTVEDIIRLQQAENIHSTPPRERVAMAEVESFLWGQKNGRWSSVDDYVNQRSGVKKRQMRQSLAFHTMPKEARDFIFTSTLPYAAGVEIGKTMGILKDYLAVKSGFDGVNDPRLTANAETTGQLVELMKDESIKQCNILVMHGYSSTVGQAKITAWRRNMAERLDEHRGRNQQEPVLELEFVGPDEQLRILRKEVHRDVRKQLQEMTKRPTAHVVEALRLNACIVGGEEVGVLIGELEGELRHSLSKIGASTVRSSVYQEPSGDDQLGLAM